MKKNVLKLLFCFLCAFIGVVKINASSSISVSSSTVTVGDTVKVSATVSGAVAWNLSINASGPVSFYSGTTREVGYTDSGRNGSKTITATYKATGTGTAKFSISGDYTNEGSSTIDISGSKSVTINPARIKETDNYLSALSIEGYNLAPSFNRDTTTYTADIEAGVSTIKVLATKNNKYANVSGDGDINVVEGNNDIDVVVTAENGSKRTYHITAIVKEFDPIKITINNSDYTVVRKKEDLKKPDLFEETTVDINGNQVPAFYNEKVGYTLVGLKDVTGAIKLYIYDKDSNKYSLYQELSFNKVVLIPLDLDKSLPRRFKTSKVTINGIELTCYTNSELGITLLYGKNLETGETGFYQFESSENTLQKFDLNNYKKLSKKLDLYTYIIIGLGGFSILLIFCTIIGKIKGKKSLKQNKKELENTMKLNLDEIKETNKLSKKDLKRLEKEKDRELEQQTEALKEKDEKLQEEEKEKEKLEEINEKKAAKLLKMEERKNKKLLKKQERLEKHKKQEKDDNMFYL